MNQKLKQVLDDYYNTIKDIRPNYRTCYNSFLEYCDIYSKYSLREMFENHLEIFDIEAACKHYIETSRKATSIEAVQRFLTAIDYFCKYLKDKNNIKCEKLEGGCRRKTIVHDICVKLNNELEQKIYLPFDGEKELKAVNEQLDSLDRKNFYQLGQSIIYRLLVTYGFKERVVINFKFEDFDGVTGKLLLSCNEENSIYICLPEDIRRDLIEYCTLNKYQNREFLFTKSNGAKLTPDSMFHTLKSRIEKLGISNFTPTTVALYGVRCESWLREYQNRNVMLSEDIVDMYIQWFNELLGTYKKNLLHKIFNYEVDTGKILISNYVRKKKLELQWENQGERYLVTESYIRFPKQETYSREQFLRMNAYICWNILMEGIAAPLYTPIIKGRRMGEPVYLPASRTGFMLTYSQLIENSLQVSFAPAAQENISALTLPYVDFLQLITKFETKVNLNKRSL